MSIAVGQGLLLKGYFADGPECNYPRPFLVIENDGSVITMLNVSSTKGKEYKANADANFTLNSYDPPFKESSFVKFDAVYKVDVFPELAKNILRTKNGNIIDATMLSKVIGRREEYSKDNGVLEAHYTVEDVITRNPRLAPVTTSSNK